MVIDIKLKGEEQNTCMQITEILLLQGTAFSSCCISGGILRYCCNAGQCKKSNLFPILLNTQLVHCHSFPTFPQSRTYISEKSDTLRETLSNEVRNHPVIDV